MPTKCCWVIHGSLTSERKASTSPSSFINHSTLLLNRALKRQAPIVFTCTSKFERSTGSERVDALGLRAVEVIICMITRDFSVISMTSQASLSLSLPLTKVTDAQYRKRFRASYNTCSFFSFSAETSLKRHSTERRLATGSSDYLLILPSDFLQTSVHVWLRPLSRRLRVSWLSAEVWSSNARAEFAPFAILSQP